jgi:hypothetical protein
MYVKGNTLSQGRYSQRDTTSLEQDDKVEMKVDENSEVKARGLGQKMYARLCRSRVKYKYRTMRYKYLAMHKCRTSWNK